MRLFGRQRILKETIKITVRSTALLGIETHIIILLVLWSVTDQWL